VNENRVKTFIQLTRQVLREDRVGQPDLFYRKKSTAEHARPDNICKKELRERRGSCRRLASLSPP
jgi:hypothetical protein